ncbi:MAG: hypothetical protein ACRCU1_13990, partial [Alsobacter sp.]
WLWDPTFTMAATSGTSDNVARDSNLCKELVRSIWYRGTFEIAWDVGVNRGGAVVDSQELWAVSRGGYRLSKEMHSSWQGVHVDLLAIDDPDDAAKVWGDAERLKTRKKVVALRNRIAHPLKSLRLIVQQRVHPEDTTWHATQSGAWSARNRKRPALLSIPLQFRASRSVRTPWGWSDPRTVEDDVSHPARYTPEFIEAEKGPEAYGLSGFEAQYNQNPETTEGGWFKRAAWGFWRIAGSLMPMSPRPEGCRPRVGDTAAVAVEIKLTPRGHLDVDWMDLNVDASFGSLSDTASAVSLTLLGGVGGHRLVLFDSTKPRTYTETEDAIREIVATWRLGRIDRLVIEDKAQGTAVMDRLRKAMAGLDKSIPPLLGPEGKPIVLPIEMVTPAGGKASRTRAILPVQEAGLVLLHDGADWLPDWVHEVSSFPFGKRDDRVDTLSQGITFRTNHSVASEQLKREANALAALARMHRR